MNVGVLFAACSFRHGSENPAEDWIIEPRPLEPRRSGVRRDLGLDSLAAIGYAVFASDVAFDHSEFATTGPDNLLNWFHMNSQ